MINGKSYDTVRDLANALDCFLSGSARQAEEVKRLSGENKDMRALLAGCYIALHDHYQENGGSHDHPLAPADEWSYKIIPVFVAIQRATGKDHGELMLKQS